MVMQLDRCIDGVRHWTVHGSNLADMVEWVRHTPKRWAQDSSVTVRASHSWDCGVGYQGALELAAKGWSEGASDLAEVQIALPALERMSKERLDMAGDTPDIGRFLAGDPRHMRRRGHTLAHRPIVSMVVGFGGCSDVDAKHMMNYGKAVLAVVDSLEAQGRRVEIIASWTSSSLAWSPSHEKARATVSWVVKEAEDHVDMAALAFSLAHPAAMRRIGFAAYERSPLRSMPGYGATTTATKDDLFDPEARFAYLPGVGRDMRRCQKPEDALNLVIEQLNNAAGETLMEMQS